MKILLISVNASYMHTNIAIRCLKNYAEKYFLDDLQNRNIEIDLLEFTINQPVGEVLRTIGFSKGDIILFSTYIWNADFITKIMPDIKKILPHSILGSGGPEFGYGAEKYLSMISDLDFIMFGEGEKTFVELLQNTYKNPETKKIEIQNMSQIKNLFFRNSDNKIIFSGERDLIKNLDEIPFPYPEIISGDFDPDHKIYYYESSRGCPYSCAYCLSSVDKRVRFKSLEQVKKELKFFLDAKISLVKFVDRTYNLNPERYIQIWKFILENHNKKTMFHFEIEAEYLNDEALDFLQQVPEGIMQFEIGVQSANKKTLASVNRSTNIEILANKIKKIPRTIHQHLDLIAGLPYEDLESFGKSYDFVMDLKPDALQLGFLKVLSGTDMAEYAKNNGWKWMETPVYETFSTPYLSFSEIAYLKDVELATDIFWNKKIFNATMSYVFRKTSPWNFISSLVDFGQSQNTFSQARKDIYWFKFLSDFISNYEIENKNCFQNLDRNLFKNLLRYDFVRSGKKGNFPDWYDHRYSKENHTDLLKKNDLLKSTRIGFSITEYEEFDFDVTKDKPENYEGNFQMLIRYDK